MSTVVYKVYIGFSIFPDACPEKFPPTESFTYKLAPQPRQVLGPATLYIGSDEIVKCRKM